MPRAVILGCAGERLNADERRFFGDADPVGFILFRRNCHSPDQVRDLVAALRDSIGRSDAPVLIDQEGGRVARLRPPSWRLYPSAACLGSLPDPQAEVAVGLGARLIADDLGDLGITVDCLPVLDIPVPGSDPVIGDRAYGTEPRRVTKLGRAACDGLLAGGVLPVTPSGVVDVPEGVSFEPEAGAGGGELPVEVVEGSPAASAPGDIGPSPDRVKPPPARAESSVRQAHRRGRLSGAMRRARSSWGAPIVALCALLALKTGFAHCIAYRQPIRRG